MIEIKNISYAYGKNEVLKDVSFEVKAGECVGILGNNGSGKSTLITCLNKVRTPKTGSVYMDKQDVHKMNRTQIARRISYVAQKNEVNQITVFDSVLMGRKPYIKWAISQKDMDICDEVINQIGMPDFKLRYVDELSGGELQKVMLARALAQQPKLMLLDEPTSNLDPKNQYEMLALVRKIAKEKSISVLIVLHDVSLALRYCDRFLFMKAGSVYDYGDESIVTKETISDVYGIESTIAEVNGKKIVVVG
jgi:iron complex transport system ATP-binding protein